MSVATIEPRTYGEAMKAGAAWDADPAISRIGSYHARHEARRHADSVPGAWCGLSADGFGVWARTTTPATEPVFIGQCSIRGELHREWRLGNIRITGAHYATWPVWDVYLLAFTPGGKHLCGHSHTRAGQVPTGVARDQRIIAAAMNYLALHPGFHDAGACGVCRADPAA